MAPDNSETRVSSSPSQPIDPGGFAPGTILAERYRIVALVGRGGMGEVYRADDRRLGQPVALKFLPPAFEHDPIARDRLLAEVRSARTVSHPNVCRVYDVGEIGPSTRPDEGPAPRSGQGRVFLTMEYIDGEDLASLLRRIGRLPAAKALEIARQLCAGLAAAHDKGVLHRDLKPANVMIDGRGHARIMDFGLAVNATASGSPADYAGTLGYMAPERFHGTPATVQSDLYALGLILYETYTGKPAFKAGTIAEWQRAHSDSTPTSPAALATDVEPAVERAILRCLEKDPAKRPTSAAQVAAALPGGDPLAAALAAGETPSPELVAASGEEGTLPRAMAWAWLAACLVALAVVVGITNSVSLVNRIPVQDPAVLRAKAQSVLRDLGYRDPPAYGYSIVGTTSPDQSAIAAGDLTGVSVLVYRQSSLTAFWLSVGDSTSYGCSTPAPRAADDTCVQLDGQDGRLLWLRVGGVDMPASPIGQSSSIVDWKPLLAAAGLDGTQFKPVEPTESSSVFRFDVQAAWQGSIGQRVYRAQAAARGGRVTYFQLSPVAAAGAAPAAAAPGSLGARLVGAASVVVPALLLVLVVALAAMARHNIRLGRGDRKGAWRVAMVMLVSGAVSTNLVRKWGADATYLWNVLFAGQGVPLFGAVAAWLYYLGFEPYVRRRWPHMLVASTRLLDGRWRDPLVGRSILIGVVAGTALFSVGPLAVLLARLPGLSPALPFAPGWILTGLEFFAGQLAGSVVNATWYCLVLAGLLLTSRVVLRRDGLAWTAVAVVAFLNFFQSGLAPALAVSSSVVMTGIIIGSARTGGLLATQVQFSVLFFLTFTPLTVDASHWYVWRSWFVVALIAGLAVWGFKNVLGRQSAFPGNVFEG